MLQEIIVCTSLAGVAAVIIKAKQDSVKPLKGRKKTTGQRVWLHVIEFFYGTLAGVILYGVANPVSLKQAIIFGIIAGVNAEMLISMSGRMINNQKAGAIEDVNQEKNQLIGGEDERNEKARKNP